MCTYDVWGVLTVSKLSLFTIYRFQSNSLWLKEDLNWNTSPKDILKSADKSWSREDSEIFCSSALRSIFSRWIQGIRHNLLLHFFDFRFFFYSTLWLRPNGCRKECSRASLQPAHRALQSRKRLEEWTGSALEGEISTKLVLSCADLSLLWSGLMVAPGC